MMHTSLVLNFKSFSDRALDAGKDGKSKDTGCSSVNVEGPCRPGLALWVVWVLGKGN